MINGFLIFKEVKQCTQNRYNQKDVQSIIRNKRGWYRNIFGDLNKPYEISLGQNLHQVSELNLIFLEINIVLSKVVKISSTVLFKVT